MKGDLVIHEYETSVRRFFYWQIDTKTFRVQARTAYDQKPEAIDAAKIIAGRCGVTLANEYTFYDFVSFGDAVTEPLP